MTFFARLIRKHLDTPHREDVPFDPSGTILGCGRARRAQFGVLFLGFESVDLTVHESAAWTFENATAMTS